MDTVDRYEMLDEKHGRGGFGEISKQRDRVLERVVAVKRLHLIADDELKQRFVQEAKTLARMSHPNVPAIYDIKYKDDNALIYFEFIEGENLRQIIGLDGVPSIQEALSWFTQVASALEHASSLGIVHRDVKPDNIIISHNKTAAYLVDFGIALMADQRRITDPGYAIGTPAYMSPEQKAGEILDQTSDIYSLGLTLYEALSGTLPAVGQQYELLSDANEAIPPSIDELIQDCIAPKSRRVASAREFITRLQGAFRTDIPLSRLLIEARLYDVQAALHNMSPEEFSSKPKGQKLLIINRAKDLIRTDKPQLQKPTADFIATLVRLAIEEPADQYKIIVDAAYEWGYEKQFHERWHGDAGVRGSLTTAASDASASAHGVLSSSLLEFTDRVGLNGKDRWYYHDLRLNLISLLANPQCTHNAERLAALFDELNQISHV